MTFPENQDSPLHLLVCTDGSPASEGVWRAALALARKDACRLRLLQVLEYNPGFASQALEALPRWEQEARAALEGLQEHFQAQGISVEIRVVHGVSASEAILAEAASWPAEVLVVGRRGKTDAKSVLLGSVTRQLLGKSPVPVLVVPRTGPFTFSRLLLATDGSPFSEKAFHHALRLARRWSARLQAVTVAHEEISLAEGEKILQELEKAAHAQGVSLATFLVEGEPGAGIVRTARLVEADLIILGSHGRTGLRRLLWGSVAQEVVGHASCPLYVVPGRPKPLP